VGAAFIARGNSRLVSSALAPSMKPRRVTAGMGRSLIVFRDAGAVYAGRVSAPAVVGGVAQ
jgi:hypothetical protein